MRAKMKKSEECDFSICTSPGMRFILHFVVATNPGGSD